MGLTPTSGRSPGGGHGNPLLYSCWRIPWTEQPGRLQFKGHKKSDMTQVTQHAHTNSRMQNLQGGGEGLLHGVHTVWNVTHTFLSSLEQLLIY